MSALRKIVLFLPPLLLSLAIVAGAWAVAGPRVAAVVAILAVLEVSLSFDNAVVNATYLRRMTAFWQTLFLTVGIAIAVFGMRLVFPFAVVAITTHLGPSTILTLAIEQPEQYAAALHQAHPAIASFGSVFLLMIFLEFVFDEEREVRWLARAERVFSRAGRIGSLSTIVALSALVGATAVLPKRLTATVLVAGIVGVCVFLAVSAIGKYFEAQVPAGDTRTARDRKQIVQVGGRAAASLFVYLEIIDASFSFDGVIGAFAISSDIFVIAAGLGIGALFVRGMTVFLVREGILNKYVYLEHGAHYAIGALAIILGISITVDLPEAVTGLVGIVIIALAVASSIHNRRALRRAAEPATPVHPMSAPPQQLAGADVAATCGAAQDAPPES